MHQNDNSRWLPVLVIAGALAVWGIALAIGAFIAPADATPSRDPRKLLVVAGTTGGFLLLWAMVLAIRVRRSK